MGVEGVAVGFSSLPAVALRLRWVRDLQKDEFYKSKDHNTPQPQPLPRRLGGY